MVIEEYNQVTDENFLKEVEALVKDIKFIDKHEFLHPIFVLLFTPEEIQILRQKLAESIDEFDL